MIKRKNVTQSLLGKSIETNASGSTSHGISRSSASVGAGQSLPVRRNPLLVGVLLSCSSRTRSQIEMGVVSATETQLLCVRQCLQTFEQTGTGDDRDELCQTRVLPEEFASILWN